MPRPPTFARRRLEQQCPFCLSQWVATGFVFGSVLAPDGTRLVASVFGTLAVADFLQFAYSAAEQQATG